MTKRKFNKGMVNNELNRIGAKLYPQRQNTKEGVRIFLVNYNGVTNGFRTLKDILVWSQKIKTKPNI